MATYLDGGVSETPIQLEDASFSYPSRDVPGNQVRKHHHKPHVQQEDSEPSSVPKKEGIQPSDVESLSIDGMTYTMMDSEFDTSGVNWATAAQEVVQCVQDCGNDQNGRFEACALDCLFG